MKTTTISCMGKPVTLYESGSPSHPAVLMIHGNSVHAGFFSPLISLLESRYHLITLDLPGHRKSEAWDKEDFTRENLAILFNSVLDFFNIREVNGFGFSMGGFILLETFDLVPAMQKLAVAGHPPLHSVAEMTGAYHLSEDSALFLQGILTESEIGRLYNAVIGIPDQVIKGEIMQSIRETSPAFRDGCLNMAQQCGNQVNRLNQFRGPVALIHAGLDLAVRNDYLEKLKIRNLWEQRIQMIPGSGHFLITEKTNELAALLDRFFSGSQPGPVIHDA